MLNVLTCITGNKDKLIDEQFQDGSIFVAFTDKLQMSNTWTVKKAPNLFKDNRRNSRLPKILTHQYIDSEYSLYID